MPDYVRCQLKKPRNGYHWCLATPKGKEEPARFLLPSSRSPEVPYNPLDGSPTDRALFRRFAEVPPTEEGVLAFAEKFGWLGEGEFVYLVTKKEAAFPFRDVLIPVDQAVVGYIDEYN